MSKTGIFSGTFDPVHAGHITFALKALERADLDQVVFIPESLPRRKDGVTHYAHRLRMLELALKPYTKLKILELPDKQFSVQKTLPRLKKLYPKDELYMLMGSDMVDLLISPRAAEQWPDLKRLLTTMKLIVAVRGKRIKEEHRQKIDMLSPGAITLASDKPLMSSRNIRESLMRGRASRDVLPSINKYIKENWLYASLVPNNS
ncbi:MAG: adenylyltransferase/cytidyltransferase family protein [bacterium]|nr:adenylyltransferase/cytidyltransferase family protein [bacterium]